MKVGNIIIWFITFKLPQLIESITCDQNKEHEQRFMLVGVMNEPKVLDKI